jgi:hypothetical protein
MMDDPIQMDDLGYILYTPGNLPPKTRQLWSLCFSLARSAIQPESDSKNSAFEERKAKMARNASAEHDRI